MHVALIANTAWLDEDLTLFRSLVVGLMGEHVSMVQVVPEGLGDEESNTFIQRITWRDSVWPALRRGRLARLAEELTEMGVDLIHGLDGRVWDGALALADRLGAPAVLGAGSALDVPLVSRLAHGNPDRRLVVVATTGPLARAVREQAGPRIAVEHVPPGVHVAELPAEANPADQALCAVISGDGTPDEDYRSLFLAVARFAAAQPLSQFFLDSQGSDPHKLWQMASEMNLLPNLSMVPRRLGHRELLLRADVLIHPQAQGRSRSLTLQAMARGLPVLARQDPWLDYLHDEQTAWLVDRSTPEAWHTLLERVAGQANRAHDLGRRAREWVREHRSTSDQVARLAGVYRQVAAESIKFPGA